MESLRIEGEIRLAIDEDPDRVISFVPDDVIFAESFYGLLTALKEKEIEYKQRTERLVKNEAVDDYGIPETAPESLALLRETSEFMRDEIDHVFGEGTSQKAFGEHLSLFMIEQFFKGIMPYVKKVRQGKTSKYTDPVVKKRQEIERAKSSD